MAAQGTMEDLKQQIRSLLVTELMLPQEPVEITDDMPLFSPEGLGLDSVDALQVVVALEKKFGLKLTEAETARRVMMNVNSIAEAVQAAGRTES
jgi:acyl carrier protein